MINHCFKVFFVITTLFFMVGWAQNATVNYFKIPVTIYDYHSDGSNPEFGALAQGKFLSLHPVDGIMTGLAATTLDTDKKIVKNPAITNPLYCVDHINKWFRTWTDGDTAIFFWGEDTVYEQTGISIVPFVIGEDTLWWDTLAVFDSTHIVHYPEQMVMCDTCIKNIVITDSMKLVDEVGNGTFTGAFSSSLLDGLGFGNEGKPHNECEAMEVHNQFVYHVGSTLLVGGDDDFWVYLNGQLAIDGGGYHSYKSTSISLDTFGLVAGQTYDFDAFWADRVAGGLFRIEGNLYFIDKRNGVDTFGTATFPHAATNDFSYLSLPGKNSIALPQATSTISWEIFDCSGRMVHRARNVDHSIAQAALSRSKALRHGVVIVRVKCYNIFGKQILSDAVKFCIPIH